VSGALTALCDSPRLYVLDGFALPDEIAHVLRATADPKALAVRGIRVKHDETGLSCELPVEGDPVLEALVARMQRVLRMDNDAGGTLRFRRYAPGESHPPHIDEYVIGGSHLIATAMLYLTDTESGGETSFPRAQPEPVKIASHAGRLAIWFNHAPDGAVDQRSYHEALAVERGEKVTLSNFVYKPLAFAARDPGGEHPIDALPAEPVRSDRTRFFCVNDGVPHETTDLLREACERRDVAYLEIDATSFDFEAARRLEPGDLMYRPAISTAAMRVEQFLYAPGVATFYKHDDSMFFDALSSPLHFERAGLPIPRTFYCSNADRTLLRSFVERLGGFPVVVKLLGGQRGVGVMRADSYPSLFSLIDYALWQGKNPLITAYIADAVHWRVVVVGTRAVAAYKNPPDSDDFRTSGGDDPADFTANPPARLAEIAVRAVDVLQNEFGGVDILEHPSGRCYLLEANFPCYFPHAQTVAGIDVAGAMLDYLLEKRARLTTTSPS
jgi:hypothetical protein